MRIWERILVTIMSIAGFAVIVTLINFMLTMKMSGGNSNLKVEVSAGRSELVGGIKRYAGSNFSIWEIEIDGCTYLANSSGGIVLKKQLSKEVNIEND